MIYFNGTEYLAGLDLAGFELNARDYRVFTNSASCKGDLGYFFCAQVWFRPRQKIIGGVCQRRCYLHRSGVICE